MCVCVCAFGKSTSHLGGTSLYLCEIVLPENAACVTLKGTPARPTVVFDVELRERWSLITFHQDFLVVVFSIGEAVPPPTPQSDAVVENQPFLAILGVVVFVSMYKVLYPLQPM